MAVDIDHPAENTPSENNTPEMPVVSERKLAANRANSRKSSGPISQAGKDRVKRNAVKHGLQAKALFVFEILGEKKEDFTRLERSLRRKFRPNGPLQEFHLETVLRCMWSIARAVRWESAEMKKSQLRLQNAPAGELLRGIEQVFQRTSAPKTEIDSTVDYLCIPDTPALDLILRYRVSGHKELSYHLAELERLQKAENGDYVPAAIRVQVEEKE